MIVVAAELFAASSGIGHMMDWARQMFQIDVVMVGVVVTGVVGFILDQMLRQVEAHFSSWKLPSR
jgi:sulfonate transport system permease protein